MTFDLMVGGPQGPNSPVCPLEVADSLSAQQVLSARLLVCRDTLMKTQTGC